MNYQPLVLACDCGYRTPTVGRSGHPLTEGKARRAFKQHKCQKAPRKYRSIPCSMCGQPATWVGRCRSCASQIAATQRNSWLDEMAVERLLAAQPVQATRAERQAAVTYLTGKRMSARLIAERLRLSERTVVRLRNRGAA